MIDCHSHLIFGVDDGAQNIEESLKMINQYMNAGYTGVICTSHYYPGKYDFDKKKYNEHFNLLDFYIKKNKINFKIFTGNEIHISENTLNVIKYKKAYTLANSNYVLIELPFTAEIKNLKDFAYDLIVNGYTPILAHAERYRIAQENFDYLRELADFGVLIQMNLSSLKDEGSKVFNLSEKLLRSQMVSLASTDAHSSTWRSPDTREYLKKLKEMVSDEYFKSITTENPERILRNEIIPVNYKITGDIIKSGKNKNGLFSNIKSLFD